MYYAEKNNDVSVEQEHVQQGMGFLPLLLGAATTLLPAILPLFAKKPKVPKGPSPAQIQAMQEAAAAQAAEAEKKKWQKYGLIGLGAVAVIGGGLFMLSRRRKGGR